MSSEAERRQSQGITAIAPPTRSSNNNNNNNQGKENTIPQDAPLRDPVAAASGHSPNVLEEESPYNATKAANTWDSTFAWSQLEEGKRKYEAYKYQEPGFCERHKRFVIVAGVIAIALAIGLAVGLTDNNNDSDSDLSFVGSLTSSKLFVMTNAQDGNEVVMYEQTSASTGLLSQVGCFPTGGIGGALGAVPLGPAIAPPDDPLASQDSLIVSGNKHCLLAVNAGSDTVTSFAVENHGLANMGVHNTQGSLPVSIAEYKGMVYVMNAGGEGSLSGFTLEDDCSLVPSESSPISLGQTGTMDPPFFVASPAQVGFTPNGEFLVVSIKGINGNPGAGTISLYPVEQDVGLGTPEVTTTNGFTPFTFDFDADGNLVIVEAFGTSPIGTADAGAVSLYTIGESGALTASATSESVPTGQTTTCWLYHYEGCLLTTNNGGNSISALSVDNGELTLLNGGSEPTLNAPIDGAFSGDGAYFYALSTGHTLPDTNPNQGQPGIYVYSVSDCSGLTQIQAITDGLPTEFETVFGAVGMALLAVEGTSDGGDISPPVPTPPESAGVSNNLFVMTNAQAGNEVVYYVSDADTGMLSRIGSFPTGGVGSALGAVPLGPALAPPDDPLASQGSVITAGQDCLIAVNAGSDTVTSFTVQSYGLQSHGAVSSGGDLPVSIAESNGVVYVMNAGGAGSISGFNLDSNCVLTPIAGSTISLGQIGTMDPPFFVASPAQVGFTPDGQFLVVSIKGINGTPGPGTISLYPVGATGLLGTPQVTTTNGNTPFSFEFDNDGNMIIVEAFGTAAIADPNAGAVSLYTVEDSGFLTVNPTSESVPTGQTTTCWIYHYEGCALTTNNGGNSISALSVSNGEVTLLNGGSEPSLNAPIDGSFSSDGRYFYAISTGHTLPAGSPGQGQPVLYAYSVSDCSLDSIQTISDGLPSEFESIFGVVGMAVMERTAGPSAPSSSFHALFTMTNAQSGNDIVMYSRDVSTGNLAVVGSFPTGGIGAALGGAEPPALAPPDDPLASQSSLIVAGGNCLIAVNAGSDTVTSFSIEDFGLLSHGMHASGGTLPVSIAESNGVVYVMNAGGAGSISGFNLNSNCVLEPMAGSTFTLGQTGTANPPFFVASPAQIGFTPDGEFLVVSIKGINGSPGPGTISLYPVGAAGILGTPQVTTTNGLTPFTFDFDNDGNLIIVEAFGTAAIGDPNAGAVSLYAVETSGALTVSGTSESVPTNQTTTCWLYHYEGCLLTTNNGGNSISAVSVSGGQLSLLNGGSEPSLNAPIDGAFSEDGAFFYVLSTGHTLPDTDLNQGQPSIYVYSVSSCSLTEIQTISDGIPNESETIFGAVGLALF